MISASLIAIERHMREREAPTGRWWQKEDTEEVLNAFWRLIAEVERETRCAAMREAKEAREQREEGRAK